ncbi:MAG: hypothetical protein LQ349_008316 [Xanthoria aureola]|nr:MAG: hypothetical protein LQ349_008316 [Xanthoria aureola]
MASRIKMRALTLLSNLVDFAQEQARAPRSKKFQRNTLGGLAAFIVVLFITLFQAPIRQRIDIPTVSLDFHQPKYNPTKVALLIENRPEPMLAPHMLHMLSVIPPDWRAQFMGSDESVAYINASRAIRYQVSLGRLDLTYIPKNMSVAGQEQISQFLTTLYLYDTLVKPAENLLVFQTDSILCSQSGKSLNDWLEYDWVGAPWSRNGRYGGNGGLSMRKVSSIIKVLKHQIRIPNSEPEDVWLSTRLGHLTGGKLANGTISNEFSVENTYTERPMGYHLGHSGRGNPAAYLGTPEKREKIWDYCPEIKMLTDMDPEQYMPGHCNENWKRDRTEEEREYTLVPW